MMSIPHWRVQAAMLLAAALAGASLGVAQTITTSTSADRQSLSLTVYNSNVALVRDVRSVRLPPGKVELRFADVASAIEPATVRIDSLTDPKKLTVLEQNFRHDLLSKQMLLHYYVGKQITLVRWVTENGSSKKVSMKATLLSDKNGLIWKVGNGIETGMPFDQYVFPALPPHLYRRPTLVWLLDNRGAGQQKLETDYMTKAMDWKADYVLTLPSEAMTADLSSWITVTNGSSTSFRNAQLQLVAGKVHQKRPAPRPMFRAQAMSAGGAMLPQIQQEGLSEYHLYTIQRPVTLPHNRSKQIAFVRASGIKVHKTYEITGQQSYFYTPYHGGQATKEPVQAHLKLKNSEANSLGVPLPGGTVRVYKADSRGQLEFVGEDHISHTPKDEELNLYIGNAFDVIAERRQTDFQGLGQNVYETAFQVTIRNHKKEAITVNVDEPITGTWTVLKSNYKYEKTSAFSLRFAVPVAAGGQSVLNYRVRVKR